MSDVQSEVDVDNRSIYSLSTDNNIISATTSISNVIGVQEPGKCPAACCGMLLYGK